MAEPELDRRVGSDDGVPVVLRVEANVSAPPRKLAAVRGRDVALDTRSPAVVAVVVLRRAGADMRRGDREVPIMVRAEADMRGANGVR
jgi:hypothetical protein